MTSPLDPNVESQLSELDLDRSRPLIIADADEVLFEFMAGLDRFLVGEGLYFDWSSFALHGNIRDAATEAPVPKDRVQDLLNLFFQRHTEDLSPVPGAAEALAQLAERAQIVVLSNLPQDRRAARSRALERHGMDYPLIANSGGKGAPVRWMAEIVSGPVFFLDDIPRHHTSVRYAAERVTRIHFIADPRLARLLGPAEHCHHRADNWPEAQSLIGQSLDRDGY